jgi:hypothetical protein
MQIPSAKRQPWRGFAAVFLVSLLLTLAWQWRGNAYGSEWSGDPDEPAHYVTGLMIHDYIANGLPGPPMAYAKRYYYSYPKVALGHWPPMFYVMQAAWTLLFTPSRVSLLLFMATLSALLLTATYALVATFFPPWMAWVSVLFLSTTNDLQASSRMVMAEIPVALFTLLALAGLARYLDSAEHVDWRDALWFSGASLAAVLTKGTGIALAPMLFLSVACGRRWRLLRSGAFWLPPLLVAVLAAAWYLAAPEALHQKVAMLGGFGELRRSRIGSAFQYWMLSLGLAGSLLALAGYLRKAWGVAAGTEKRGWWIVIVIFIPVTVACCVLFGTWEVRHLLNAVPLLMLCLCDGLDWVLAKVGRYRQVASVLATAILALTAVRSVAAMPAKTHLGLDLVARDLVSSPEYAKDRFLIVSDALGEGVFIAEVASREKRPGHIIERGSKVLAEESFLGDRVRLFFTTPEELMLFFEKTPDRIVILDGIQSGEPYQKLVREAIRRYPDRWLQLGVYPRAGAPLPLAILRLRNTNPANIENRALTRAGRVRRLREVDP